MHIKVFLTPHFIYILFIFQPRKVQVEVYYETLCPDTRLFIRSQLYPAWDELEHIMDIHWKPYGKATVSSVFYIL